MERAKPIEKRYLHEMSDTEWDEYKNSGKTWGDARTELAPPDWCDAGIGVIDPMGCWGLVMTRSVRCEGDCKSCDFYAPDAVTEKDKEVTV